MPAATPGHLSSGWAVKRIFAAAFRAPHHSKKVASVSSSWCSPSANSPFPDDAWECVHGSAPFPGVFDICSKAFPHDDTHSPFMDSPLSCVESSSNTFQVSRLMPESLILPSEPATPILKRLRPLPAIPNESRQLSRPIRTLPTPPLSSDSRRNAHPAVLRVETRSQSVARENSCDSPTIIATPLPPLSHAVARGESTLGPDEDAARNPIDWDLLEQLLCGKGAER